MKKLVRTYRQPAHRSIGPVRCSHCAPVSPGQGQLTQRIIYGITTCQHANGLAEPCAIFPPLTSFLQLFLLPGLVLIWRYLACLWNSQRGYISLGDLHSPSLHHCPAMRNRTNMASISAAVASSSCFSQGESPPLPTPRSIEDLMHWFSSELHVGPHPVGMQTFMC